MSLTRGDFLTIATDAGWTPGSEVTDKVRSALSTAISDDVLKARRPFLDRDEVIEALVEELNAIPKEKEIGFSDPLVGDQPCCDRVVCSHGRTYRTTEATAGNSSRATLVAEGVESEVRRVG